jgi:hypothetical protein
MLAKPRLGLKGTHLFDDVGTELLDRQDANVADELSDERLAESNIVQVEDVFYNKVSPQPNLPSNLLTDDIVSERVLYQSQGVVGDFSNELNSLRVGSVVDASLQDTTSVTVSGDFDTVSGNSVVDELQGHSALLS